MSIICSLLNRHSVSGLPAPHTTSTDVITENDILEEDVRPKPSQMTDLPKPPPKRNRQPVKITLPALEQVRFLLKFVHTVPPVDAATCIKRAPA